MPKTAPRAGVRRALNQKQLVPFYQPIHELESRKIVAAEALLRARRGSGEIRNAESISSRFVDDAAGVSRRRGVA